MNKVIESTESNPPNSYPKIMVAHYLVFVASLLSGYNIFVYASQDILAELTATQLVTTALCYSGKGHNITWAVQVDSMPETEVSSISVTKSHWNSL